jgi:hypothetical protein
MITFNNEKTNKEVFETIRNHTKSFDLEQLVNDARTELFHMDDAIRTLYFATVTGQNAILYGPGGYGKSKVVKYFYKKLGIPVYTLVCNSATTVEDLLGIPNMKKIMEESKYEIAFENTLFNNKGILFLEEGLDMQPEVASALKDVLSTKGYHRENEIIPSFISSVVIATNKNPNECALDDSTAAFYEERFPHVLKMEWKEHTYETYLEFLLASEVTFDLEKNVVKLLASVFEENKLSPRKCLYYTEVINSMGIGYLTHIDSLNTSSIEDMKELSIQKDIIATLLSAVNTLKTAIITDIPGQPIEEKIKAIQHMSNYLLTLKCPEDQIDLRDSWITKATAEIKKYGYHSRN